MKSSIKSIFLVLAISTLIAGCNSGKNLYVKGNYYEAVLRSVDKLRKSPNSKKARETLANAYPSAVNTFLDQLENDKNSNIDFKNTNAVYTFQKLNRMYESIQRSPAAKEVITNPNKYYKSLENVKPLAAEEQYEAGIYQLSVGYRENAKQAYYNFLEADKFVSNYKDVSDKIDEAYNLSIIHIIADLKPVQSRFYDLSADVFYSQVKHVLNQIEQKEFIRFYSLEEAKNMNLKDPDQILEINFEDFVVGETHTKERVEKMERDSLKVGEVTLDDGSKEDVYGTVKAVVSINRMEVISKGIINLSITQNGNENKKLIFEDIAGNYVWFNEWGFYNGDERALTEEQLAICHRKRIDPIPPQQMFVEFTKPIQNQLRNRLVSFYNNY
jgi:hypothetical protein